MSHSTSIFFWGLMSVLSVVTGFCVWMSFLQDRTTLPKRSVTMKMLEAISILAAALFIGASIGMLLFYIGLYNGV